MNDERRRNLKKIGKQKVKETSEKIKKIIEDSNPKSAPLYQRVKNSIDISRREKRYHSNRKEIYSKEAVGKSILLLPVSVNLSRGYLPIQGYYLHCLTCGDLIPMNCEIDLGCKCDSIHISPTKETLLKQKSIEVVRLIAKAEIKISPLSRFIGKMFRHK